jgi:hypothetical protein
VYAYSNSYSCCFASGLAHHTHNLVPSRRRRRGELRLDPGSDARDFCEMQYFYNLIPTRSVLHSAHSGDEQGMRGEDLSRATFTVIPCSDSFQAICRRRPEQQLGIPQSGMS